MFLNLLKGVTPTQPAIKPTPQLPESQSKPSQYELFVNEHKRQQQQKSEQEEREKNGQPKIDSDATRLVSDFRPPSPPPDYEAKKQSIYSDDDETDDELELLEEYFREYKDRFESNDEKMPKWRIMYERTGNFNTVFRAAKRMSCKIKKIDNFKFKFTDSQKTTINVNEATNNLILKYEKKRGKSGFVTSIQCEHKVKYFKRDSDNSDRIVKLSTGKDTHVIVDFSVVPVCVENEINTEQVVIIKEEIPEPPRNPFLKKESLERFKKLLDQKKATSSKFSLTNQEKSTETNLTYISNINPTETETKLPTNTINSKYVFSKGDFI